LVSGHLLAEMAPTADNLIVTGRGRLVADTTVEQLRRTCGTRVLVRVDDSGLLRTALKALGGRGMTGTGLGR